MMGLQEALNVIARDGYSDEKRVAIATLNKRAPQLAALALDMGKWIDDSMHKEGDDLATGHALLARLDQIEKGQT